MDGRVKPGHDEVRMVVSKFGEELTESLKQAGEIARSERRLVTIPVKDWDRFKDWANKPAREVPGLKELSKRRPTWRK